MFVKFCTMEKFSLAVFHSLINKFPFSYKNLCYFYFFLIFFFKEQEQIGSLLEQKLRQMH